MSERASLGQTVTRERFDAVLFDLDGVLTDTAVVHARCWQQVFDAFLETWANARGEPFQPFDLESDYNRHVDGKARHEGARDFLSSRSIVLPEGTPNSPATEDSIFGIAKRKDALFSQALEAEPVTVYPGAVRWLRSLRERGFRTAVVSASHHCAEVLRAASLDALFEVRVDGWVADRLGLAGKPSPDPFLEGAKELGVEPGRAVVVEDALAGVAAGRAGGFGLVVGVARGSRLASLAAAGADLVVRDLGELLR